MKTYAVTIKETVTRTATIEVQAMGLEDAEDAAVIRAVVARENGADPFSEAVVARYAEETKEVEQ